MADDNFEIDIYGDANDAHQEDEGDDSKLEESNNHSYDNNSSITIANGSNPDSTSHPHSNEYETNTQDTMSGHTASATPSQGTKRKEAPDSRPVDPGATTALLLSELQWWVTDDEIRGWVRQASCEDELKDITFSEHKVNGKSKGQAYIEFTTHQAATAVKRQMDDVASDLSHSSQPGGKKLTVIYTSHTSNPFKTLPKDAPARANKDGAPRGGSNMGGYSERGNYRGRGNFNGPRGGFNRNFSGGGGFHGNGPNGGFNNNNMGGGGNFGGGFNNMGGGGNFPFRGGMMQGNMGGGMRGGGMRGGRGGGGGMNPGMNAGMMGGMGPMGPMPMMGFQQPPHFNPAFFGGNQQSDWQNPHGAKRPREN
ncbi:hypothetical protein M426DRAFT_74356 [Hypoxylon sp. CI-4A]|nr:hypothetical protein M426DRAFT_74356 [Hypoxylon sp. CI-4A]